MNALVRSVVMFAIVLFMASPAYAADADLQQIKKIPMSQGTSFRTTALIVEGSVTCQGILKWTPIRNSIYSFLRLEDGSCRGVLGGPEGEHISFENVTNPSVCDDLSRWFTGRTNEPGNTNKIAMYGCTDGQVHPMPEELSVHNATGYIFTNITQIRFY